MNAVVRAAVMDRAGGCCEHCREWAGEQLRFDHFFGRAKAPEDLEHGWALCIRCDTAKTLNDPDSATWLERFIAHCDRHGLRVARACAQLKLIWVRAKAELRPTFRPIARGAR